MRSLLRITSFVFAFFLIDLNLFRLRRRSQISFAAYIERELKDKKVRRKSKRYKKRKYKRKSHFKSIHYALKGTNAKDPRFSNHKKLRRMYRND